MESKTIRVLSPPAKWVVRNGWISSILLSAEKKKNMEEKEKEKFWYEAGSFITKKGIKVTLYREVK